MGILHSYSAAVTWTGAGHTGTAGYASYSRDHEVEFPGKPLLLGSAEPTFRGDAGRYNPEELLVGALAQCHMLWFLHLAADAGVVVTGYHDDAAGTMRVRSGGMGRFTEVVLHPRVTLREDVPDHVLAELHERAGEYCFIKQSVNFPVRCEPTRHVVETDEPAEAIH
ncbi:MAG: OsmC family protein [Actinomycetales bacterium]|nr:OsmC family protein [Actinomycetales bacterium]